MAQKTNCESCLYYGYNEEYECYECTINLDEDEMMQFLSNSSQRCTHFKFGDEYSIVRKQI
ncbi:DUF6472 family protein [Lacrimispora sp. JR3]|uniref:DUF6472 family protein n=1 Tax=Lacrimispora sinapis TaxID=3111456 RepID=UPI003748F3D8